MGASEGKPGQSPRKEPNTIDSYVKVTIGRRSRCSRHPRSLGKNNIGATGAQRLAEALAGNTTLRELE